MSSPELLCRVSDTRARCSQSLFPSPMGTEEVPLRRLLESLIGTRDYGLSDSVFKDRQRSAGPVSLAGAFACVKKIRCCAAPSGLSRRCVCVSSKGRVFYFIVRWSQELFFASLRAACLLLSAPRAVPSGEAGSSTHPGAVKHDPSNSSSSP